MSLTNWLAKLSSKVNSGISKTFDKYGSFTYRYPVVVLIGSLVFLMAVAYGFTLYEEETDGSKLWVPDDALALEHQDTVNEVFQEDSIAEMVYVVAKNQGDNLLTANAFNELIAFETGFWNTVSNDGQYYDDLCAKGDVDDPSRDNESACRTTRYPLMFFLKSDGTFESANSGLVSKINSGKGTSDFYPVGSTSFISIEGMFGATTPETITTTSTGTNNIQQAEAISWIFYLSNDIDDLFREDFEANYEVYADEFNKNSQYITIYTYTESAISRQGNDFDHDLALIQVGIALIVFFSFFILGKLNTYESRIFISFFGVVSVGIAYVEAVSLGAFFGFIGSGIVGVVPFLMLGIGVDDMYVLIYSLNQAPKEFSGEEKMRYMMRNAGVSITITSLTNFSAFAIGSITSIPAIHAFCWYAAFGMLFDYLNQITFFLAILAFDIRRSEKPRGDCCGLIFCKPDSKACCMGKYTFNEDGSAKQDYSEKIAADYYAPFLMRTPVKIVAIVVFTGLLAMNIYGVTQLEQEFDFEWFTSEDSAVKDTFAIREEYFSDAGLSVHYYSVYSDFETTENQEKLENLESLIENCDGCEKQWIVQGTTDSWYFHFKNWVSLGNCPGTAGLSGNYVPSATFYSCLKTWETSDDGSIYSSKLAWNEAGTKLIGSDITADMIKLDKAEDKVQAMYDTRDIGDKGPDDTFPYNNDYQWYEQAAVFGTETAIGLSSSLAFVFLVFMITNADILAAVFMLGMVGFTVIGQIANLYFWDDYLNIVTMVNSIMAVGISVDYSAHFIHAYKGTQGADKNERVINTFRVIGVSIFNGGLSTFLAISPLVASKTYVFETFFKCWFSIVVYGLGHALILLPVILSFVSLPSHVHEEDEEKEKNRSGSVVEAVDGNIGEQNNRMMRDNV